MEKLAKIVLLALSVFFFSAMMANAQSIMELQRNPDIKPDDLKHIPILIKTDSLKPVYYSRGAGFTTDPDTTLRLLGCTGDFNNDRKTDYALIVNNREEKQDQLVAFVIGIDTVFVLRSFTPLKEIVEKNPVSRMLSRVVCYAKSETGKFEGLEDNTYDMPGDLINYAWKSYLWDGKSGFRDIITSD